jgi:hypothetical protein
MREDVTLRMVTGRTLWDYLVERYNGNGRWDGKINIVVGMVGWKKKCSKRFKDDVNIGRSMWKQNDDIGNHMDMFFIFFH